MRRPDRQQASVRGPARPGERGRASPPTLSLSPPPGTAPAPTDASHTRQRTPRGPRNLLAPRVHVRPPTLNPVS